jgi:hypothetical protein
MEKKLAITDATHIQAVQKGMPAHLIQDAQLKKYTDVHFVAPGLKPVITKVTPVVSTTHR